jgi:hypothetical protein
MTDASRQLAGILFVLVPTVEFGGWSLLRMIARRVPGYLDNPVRQNLFRAGHAHAGVLLLLALAPILMPAGFFLSVLRPSDDRPNRLIVLVYLGALSLAVSAVTLGLSLL